MLTPYQYPSDPKIAEHFYEENASNNKDKTNENTDIGKGKIEEKVNRKEEFFF